jgi:hypothetical protein
MLPAATRCAAAVPDARRAGVYVGRLSFVVDHPLSESRARALGDRFAGALHAALMETGHAGRLHIEDLVVEVPLRELDDPRALARLATSTVRRVLDQAPE